MRPAFKFRVFQVKWGRNTSMKFFKKALCVLGGVIAVYAVLWFICWWLFAPPLGCDTELSGDPECDYINKRFERELKKLLQAPVLSVSEKSRYFFQVKAILPKVRNLTIYILKMNSESGLDIKTMNIPTFCYKKICRSTTMDITKLTTRRMRIGWVKSLDIIGTASMIFRFLRMKPRYFLKPRIKL